MTGLPDPITDANGITWYRPDFDGKSPPPIWGWTSQTEQAHPAYLASPERKAPPPMTELDANGIPDRGRYTDYSRYPLPATPPREDVQFDSWGRYKLPSPTTGRLTSYSRATTLSSATADHFHLGQWRIRSKVQAVLAAQQHALAVQSGDADNLTDNEMAMACTFNELQTAMTNGSSSKKINDLIDLIDDFNGAADSRELGQFVHDWIGELDMGRALLHQLPEQAQPYARSYQAALQKAGLIAVPEYVERVVLNDQGEETVAGRIDRLYWHVESKRLLLGDLKTSKTLDFSLMEYAMQFAVYGYATLMLGLDGLTWEEMPKIDQDFCVVVHLPSDQPERASVVPFDLFAGGEGLITAMQVRRQRREIPKRVLSHTLPTTGEDTIRYVQARQAIQNITSVDDAIAVREQYQDVWNDDLDEFGTQCFGLLATTDEEN